jgi:predicted amidophosphoribosyltransferase
MTECPDCGKPVSPAAAVCPDCGIELTDEQIEDIEQILDLADEVRELDTGAG